MEIAGEIFGMTPTHRRLNFPSRISYFLIEKVFLTLFRHQKQSFGRSLEQSLCITVGVSWRMKRVDLCLADESSSPAFFNTDHVYNL